VDGDGNEDALGFGVESVSIDVSWYSGGIAGGSGKDRSELMGDVSAEGVPLLRILQLCELLGLSVSTVFPVASRHS
jgi:hypothetical protein